MSISDLAEAVGVRWETVRRIIDKLNKKGYVSVKKMETFPFKIVVALTERGRKLSSELFPREGQLTKGGRVLVMVIYGVGGEVFGATKLEKLPFLLERELGVDLERVFTYIPYKYGPFSIEVMKSVRELAFHGFVSVEEKVIVSKVGAKEEHVMRIYRLTPKGQKLAEDLFKKIPEEDKRKFKGLKAYANKSIRELLDYVYTKYPEFKRYTTLDQFF